LEIIREQPCETASQVKRNMEAWWDWPMADGRWLRPNGRLKAHQPRLPFNGKEIMMELLAAMAGAFCGVVMATLVWKLFSK
jgi:hypothetical protein